MIHVGIIGAGLLGGRHAGHWARLPARITGWYDVDPQKADQAAARYGGQVYGSAEDLARAVDIVDVASPTPFHKEGVMAAASHRKHVFCEKPLARTVHDAREMAAACERAGIRLYVGQTLRFFPQYVRARRLLGEGVIGNPRLIRLARTAGHPATFGGRAWFRAVEMSGGAVMEGGIHDMDFARWCLGDVEHVFARGITFREGLPFPADHMLVTLRFRSGALGVVEASWMRTDGKLRQMFELVGTKGMLTFDSHPGEQTSVTLRAVPCPSRLPLWAQGPVSDMDDAYYAQLAHFLDGVLYDKPFRVTPEDAVASVALCVAALESAKLNRIVAVAEVG